MYGRSARHLQIMFLFRTCTNGRLCSHWSDITVRLNKLYDNKTMIPTKATVLIVDRFALGRHLMKWTFLRYFYVLFICVSSSFLLNSPVIQCNCYPKVVLVFKAPSKSRFRCFRLKELLIIFKILEGVSLFL